MGAEIDSSSSERGKYMRMCSSHASRPVPMKFLLVPFANSSERYFSVLSLKDA